MNLSDIPLTKLPGVGPEYEKRFKKIGITTILDILLAGAEEIHVKTGMKKEPCNVLVSKAKEYLEKKDLIPKSEMTSRELYEYRESIPRITTGSLMFDNMLAGGFELGQTASIYGGDGSGKTQVCHNMVVRYIQQTGRKALWLEIENTYRPERIIQIALENGYAKDKEEAMDKFLDNIVLKTCKDSTVMQHLINHSTETLVEENIGFIIVDGSVGRFRLDFRGRGTLSDRQVDLGTFVTRLDKIAYYLRIGVLVTNQVTANLELYGAKVLPIGGYIMGHFANCILYISRSGEVRKITLKKSSYIPEHTIEIKITNKGIEDTPENIKKLTDMDEMPNES